MEGGAVMANEIMILREKITTMQDDIDALKSTIERRLVDALVIESEHDTEIVSMQAEIDELKVIVFAARAFVEANQLTFSRMEVAEYDDLVESVHPANDEQEKE